MSEQDWKRIARKMRADDRNAIPYRPRFVKHVGSVEAALLLAQIEYWWEHVGRQAFYKFLEPCHHERYRPGDSWNEELGFSADVTHRALQKIGTKVTRGGNAAARRVLSSLCRASGRSPQRRVAAGPKGGPQKTKTSCEETFLAARRGPLVTRLKLDRPHDTRYTVNVPGKDTERFFVHSKGPHSLTTNRFCLSRDSEQRQGVRPFAFREYSHETENVRTFPVPACG